MEPVSLKYGKLATKYPRIYGYILQCIADFGDNHSCADRSASAELVYSFSYGTCFNVTTV